MDGRCRGVVVVVGWIEGYVGGTVVGEGFVEHLLGLGLRVA